MCESDLYMTALLQLMFFIHIASADCIARQAATGQLRTAKFARLVLRLDNASLAAGCHEQQQPLRALMMNLLPDEDDIPVSL